MARVTDDDSRLEYSCPAVVHGKRLGLQIVVALWWYLDVATRAAKPGGEHEVDEGIMLLVVRVTRIQLVERTFGALVARLLAVAVLCRARRRGGRAVGEHGGSASSFIGSRGKQRRREKKGNGKQPTIEILVVIAVSFWVLSHACMCGR